ncbi:MAG: glycoside hydrolase family 20 zincin-like fold domain-containing protein, partial [Bryobacteraceae bacterium]
MAIYENERSMPKALSGDSRCRISETYERQKGSLRELARRFGIFLERRMGKECAALALTCLMGSLAGAGLLTAPLYAATQPAANATWSAANFIPMPRQYSAVGASALVHGVSIRPDSNASDRFAASDLEAWFRGLDIKVTRKGSAFRISLLRADSHDGKKLLDHAGMKFDSAMHDEGYIILPSRRGLAVIGETAPGVFYGAQTVKQMVAGRGHSAMLERASIRDWPAMRYRGISDDLSRGPIPTLKIQEKIIRTLASYKMNLYSPYFENTLAYRSNPLPALPGESISQADAKALVAYARPYHIMIVPEQESFGHLHKVLIYQEYAPLAETPLGTVLAPGQSGSLDLIDQWFT